MTNKLVDLIEKAVSQDEEYRSAKADEEETIGITRSKRNDAIVAWNAVYDQLCELAKENDYNNSPFNSSKLYNFFKPKAVGIHTVGDDDE